MTAQPDLCPDRWQQPQQASGRAHTAAPVAPIVGIPALAHIVHAS
jgi:hypothetical protein